MKIPQYTGSCSQYFIGALSAAFYNQAKSIGLEKIMKMYFVRGSLEAISHGPAEGGYIAENFLRIL